jgi:hypothetical protein
LRWKKPKKHIVAMWIAGMMVLTASPVSAAHFSDMPSTHWAYASVEWASRQGIVTGYEDGTFKPSRQVTEAEFLVMYMHYFFNMDSIPDRSAEQKYWADSYYQSAAELHVPVQGGAYKDGPVRRGLVARMITKAIGYDYSEKQAVEWLLEKEIVSGREAGTRTYASYAPDAPLARAEAAQLFKTLYEKDYTRFISR